MEGAYTGYAGSSFNPFYLAAILFRSRHHGTELL